MSYRPPTKNLMLPHTDRKREESMQKHKKEFVSALFRTQGVKRRMHSSVSQGLPDTLKYCSVGQMSGRDGASRDAISGGTLPSKLGGGIAIVLSILRLCICMSRA